MGNHCKRRTCNRHRVARHDQETRRSAAGILARDRCSPLDVISGISRRVPCCIGWMPGCDNYWADWCWPRVPPRRPKPDEHEKPDTDCDAEENRAVWTASGAAVASWLRSPGVRLHGFGLQAT